MPAAIIGGVIAAGGAVASASIANKGASKAAQATQQASDQAAQVQRETYAQSAQALQPWQQSGLSANAMLNDFYGIPQQQQVSFAPMGMNALADSGGFNDLSYGGAFGNPNYGQTYGQPYGLGGMTGQLPNWQNMTVNTPAPNSRDAFANFIANSDYGFQFGNGSNAVNSGYAGAGTLKSGAAMKALEDYRQGLQKGYRGEFLSGLANQANTGFGAASAQAGVSQNLGNNLAGIYQNQGNNLANAALVKAQNTGNAVNSLANIGAYTVGRI